jgi:hypothetical protein
MIWVLILAAAQAAMGPANGPRPLWTITEMRSTAAGAVTCTYVVPGVGRHRGGEECGILEGSGAAVVLRGFGRAASFDFDLTARPEETEAPLAPHWRGVVMYEASAQFSVGPDGRVTDCTTSSRVVDLRVAPIRIPDLCFVLGAGRWAMPAWVQAGAGIRHGQARAVLLFRLGTR